MINVSIQASAEYYTVHGVNAGGVNAPEAAEASTLKALMQLNATASVKRVVREKRLVRSTLQDAQDTLLHSLAVTSQLGPASTVPHLVQLHCLTAVQDTLPQTSPNPSATDAPPGFAPIVVDTPPAPSLLLTHMWPFHDAPSAAGWSPATGHWSAHDNPKPMLQLLRVHQQLDGKQKRSVCQRLRLGAMHAAATSHNYKLAERLGGALQAPTEAASSWQCAAKLLQTQIAHDTGDLDAAAATQQLQPVLVSLQTLPADARDKRQVAAVQLQVLLQLAEWSSSGESLLSTSSLDGDQGALRQIISDREVAGVRFLADGHPSVQGQYLHAAVSSMPQSAAALLAYGDYLHSICQDDSDDGTGAHKHSQHDRFTAAEVSPTGAGARQVQALQAYCLYLASASQSTSSAGDSLDCTPVLLKVLELVRESSDLVDTVMQAMLSVPQLVWRNVVPQLFALLAHDDPAISGLAQRLLYDLSCVDAAAVLYPALVESKRVEKGKNSQRCNSFERCVVLSVITSCNVTSGLSVSVLYLCERSVHSYISCHGCLPQVAV